VRTTLGGDASFLIGRALGLMGVIRPAQRGDAAPEFLLCTSENGQMRARRAGTKCNPTDSTRARMHADRQIRDHALRPSIAKRGRSGVAHRHERRSRWLVPRKVLEGELLHRPSRHRRRDGHRARPLGLVQHDLVDGLGGRAGARADPLGLGDAREGPCSARTWPSYIFIGEKAAHKRTRPDDGAWWCTRP